MSYRVVCQRGRRQRARQLWAHEAWCDANITPMSDLTRWFSVAQRTRDVTLMTRILRVHPGIVIGS